MYTGKLPASIEKILAGMEEVEITPSTVQLNTDGSQHVVGVLPEELQRLMGLWKKREREYDEMNSRFQTEIDAIDSRIQQKETAKRLQNQLNQEGREIQQLAENLWTSMRLTFPDLADKKTIGIAEDFQAYWEEEKEEEEEGHAYRTLLGWLPPGASIDGLFIVLDPSKHTGGPESDEPPDDKATGDATSEAATDKTEAKAPETGE
jgi:hypothetical protein